MITTKNKCSHINQHCLFDRGINKCYNAVNSTVTAITSTKNMSKLTNSTKINDRMTTKQQ